MEYCNQLVLSVCLSVHEHITGTAGLILTKLSVQIACGCGSVLLWWRCGTLCTSGLRMTSRLAVMGATLKVGGAAMAMNDLVQSDVYECLFWFVITVH